MRIRFVFVMWFTVLNSMGVMAYASIWQNMWQNKNQQARSLLETGRPDLAAGTFSDPSWQACAYYQAGQYKQAAQLFSNITGEEAQYNRANALAHLGQYQEAIKLYAQVLKHSPQHQDAQFNKTLLEKLLEKQKKEQKSCNQPGKNSQTHNNTTDQLPSDPNQGADNSASTPPSPNKTRPSSGQQQGQSKQAADNKHADSEKDQGTTQSQPSGPTDKASSPSQNQSGTTRESSEHSNSAQGTQEDVKNQSASTHSPLKQGHQEKSEEARAQSAPAIKEKKSSSVSQHTQQQKEKQQAYRAWLKSISDNPGGILKQKFLQEHIKRRGSNKHEH